MRMANIGSVLTQASGDANSAPILWRQRLRQCLHSFCHLRCKCFSSVSLHETNANGDININQPTTGGQFLLPDQNEPDKHCMILDLDETLVHSTFEPIQDPDFVITVEVKETTQKIYVLKRPHVDEFLAAVGNLYECILFTASLKPYADQVATLLDRSNTFKCRLFRESCLFRQGCYIKDLNRLGRKLERVIILDNSPVSYMMHPDNAVPVKTWFDDKADEQLLKMLPFLQRLAKVENVYSILRNSNHPFIGFHNT